MEPISALQSIWEGFDFSTLTNLLLGIIPALICLSVHEFSHGLTAWALGDNTARDMGRLSLNPIKHIDIMGLIMMLGFHVGWAKPVPVNMYNFKNPKQGMALTALAGPMSNFVLSIVFIFLFGVAYVPCVMNDRAYFLLDMLQTGSYISLGLGVFNLIPLPPLDGSKFVFSLLSDESYYKLMKYERFIMPVVVILVASGLLGEPLSQLISFLYKALTPIAQFGADFVYYLFYK